MLISVAIAGFSLGPGLWLYAKYKQNTQKASSSAFALSSKSDKPLPVQAAIRGAYTNIGSKDIGPDTKETLNKLRNKR